MIIDAVRMLFGIEGLVLAKHVVNSPARVRVAKTDRATVQFFILNLNEYRSAHYRTLDKGKSLYCDSMKDKILALPVMEKVFCIYTTYRGTRRKYDTANVCSIHEKFFMDALVKHGRLPDDNTDYCIGSACLHGGIDKENPRVDITILEIS